jgi:SAM-dependent methyltransferase
MTNLFSEDDIRPVKLRNERRSAELQDIGRMLSWSRKFIHVNCPACNASTPIFKFKKMGISYDECEHCQTYYINPRPTPEILKWFYEGSINYAYWNEVIFPQTEKSRRANIFVPRVNQLLAICNKYKIETRALLEVGSGYGTFCAEVQDRGIFDRVVAVEPTPSLAKTCIERGLTVLNLPIEEIEFKESERFDVVASFEVIEHLFSPRDFCNRMKKFIRPGGILILTCPNGAGFDVETLGIVSDTIDCEHLNYFNPGSLSGLLSECGFEILETMTPGELDADLVRNKVLSKEFNLDDQPFLRKILIDKWHEHGKAFQNFLQVEGLSSSLWIVAKVPLDSL